MTRILLTLSGIALVAVLFLPIWKIELNAPQYPEGLSLTVHATGLRGNVAIINGLNHYIGMKTLHNEDFPEFTILPFCIGFFVLLFLLAAIMNKRKLFFTTFFLFVAFGVIAMADFWRWEYNYGHNLDPHAAIIVPGMAYQPPLIGYKQLLNFGAYSIPDIGGWIFIGCGALLLTSLFVELRRGMKLKKTLPLTTIISFITISMSSCNPGPEAIKTGIDNCSFCKMTISDPRFGAELVTGTGKVFKFDDIICMNKFLATMEVEKKEKSAFYLTDFCGRHALTDAAKCKVLRSELLKSPMNGQMAAFTNTDSLEGVKKAYAGEEIDWKLIK